MKNYQHQPLRKPEGWTGQDAALVIQLERQLDDIYKKLGALKEKLGIAEETLGIAEETLAKTTRITEFKGVSTAVTFTLEKSKAYLIEVVSVSASYCGLYGITSFPSGTVHVAKYSDASNLTVTTGTNTVTFTPASTTIARYFVLETGDIP